MKTGESEWSAEKVIMFYAATPNTDRETERKTHMYRKTYTDVQDYPYKDEHRQTGRHTKLTGRQT